MLGRSISLSYSVYRSNVVTGSTSSGYLGSSINVSAFPNNIRVSESRWKPT